ncbi:aminotransferase class I/II-fold pyridoxal phosphate-dependent enzyme [Candidatus Woesearchaeota archaeon]|nr:aminotransferase class I/II-fold pyridoxal phosphate-dependent enzyme [Candidatus Woesearchaeota archaeon]
MERFLSRRGKDIQFPKKGLISQIAEAKDMTINATAGIALTDDGAPMHLGAIGNKIDMAAKDVFSYASSYGNPELRKLWKEHIRLKNPSLGDFSNPVVTAGLTHGVSIAGYLFCDEGDQVILPDHYWDNYDLALGDVYGAKIKTYPLFDDSAFNVAGLAAVLQKQTGKQIVLLNFPHNPTGYSPSREIAYAIKDVLVASAERGNDVVVLCDDAYFELFFEDTFTQSMFSILADAHVNLLAVKIDGATKEDLAWGLRVGFISFGGQNIDYAALEDKAAAVVRGTVSNASQLSQSLLVEAYKDGSYAADKQKAFDTMRERYVLVRQLVNQYGLTTLPFNSGYFMCVSPPVDAEKVRLRLLEAYDTGVVRLGDQIRVAFSGASKKKLPRLFGNIAKAIGDLS